MAAGRRAGFGIVDSHVHLWDPRRVSYPWLSGLDALERPFLVDDYHAACGKHGVAAMVFLECDAAPSDSLRELDLVEKLAAAEPRLRAVVARAPVEDGERARAALERLAARPLVRGVRRIVQGEADPAFCLRDDFARGVGMLAEFGLHFELCVKGSQQMASALELARRCPEVRFVLDHIGKPDIPAAGSADPGEFEVWAEQIRAFARLDNLWCKLSGLVVEADPAAWTPADLEPYSAQVLECFGAKRVMFGSDWPVVLQAATLDAWIDTALGLAAGLSAEERRAVFADNALAFYRIPADP